MTALLQPLDAAFFAPFKKLLRRCVGKFMLQCGRTLGSVSPPDKPAYLKDCLSKKNISNVLIKKWIPTCLMGVSPRFVRTGWSNICKSVFPQLGELPHGLQSVYMSPILETPFFEGIFKKAEEWPNFNDTPRLKDALHGFDYDNYPIATLKKWCDERGLAYESGARRPALLEILQSYEKQIDEGPEFQTPAEFEEEEETNEPEDNADGIITYTDGENEVDNTDADQQAEIEAASPESPPDVDVLYEIEKFVKVVDEEKNTVEVKWPCYSSRHNTVESMERLSHELEEEQFNALLDAIEPQHKERAKKRRR
jgi:hypothetical protein